ncbi:MAG: hypothetical protein ACLGXA_18930 [Acidobacteriota bacterium]
MHRPLRPPVVFLGCCLSLSVCFAAKAAETGTSTDNPRMDAARTTETLNRESVAIPGPLRSFLRMAGISQEAPAEDVLPLVARNVSLHGYQNGGDTEYLVLLRRYVDFARELQRLTHGRGEIRVETCEEAERLVDVLGYQFAEGCGEKNAYVVTANAERAFLAIDSGFPLTAMEEALEKHQPFVYPFPSTQVPVMFKEQDWTGISIWRPKGGTTLLDALLRDRQLDLLYWALSKNDEQTRTALRQAHGLRWMLAIAPALDFYGSQLSIRGGRVVVPGGAPAEHAWSELAGAKPESPGEFVDHVFSRDRGWMAAYFDALSRVNRAQQVHLTESQRLRQLYDVYRRAAGNTDATRGVFPRNADLLILFSRVHWQPDGSPYIPGSLAVWKDIFTMGTAPKLVHGWVRSARSWDSPEQLLMTLVACSNFPTDDGPLQIYLTLSAIDNARAAGARLDDGTVRMIASKFSEYHSWYMAFSEFPALNDTSVVEFVRAADAMSGISNATLRANALGSLQANVGLWEILARQQQIPAGAMNASWQGMVQPFIGATTPAQLFEAARSSLRASVTAASGQGNLSEDQVIELLAGPAQTGDTGKRVHEEIAQRIRSVLDDQRLVSLDTLFGLYDGLDQLAHGASVRDQLIQEAGSLHEFEMPRAIFTAGEKAAWAPEIYTSRHAELQVRTDLTKQIEGASTPAQLEAARGDLTPFLRDTLVGLNYAYYEPPGAEVLHNNPLFVRSHDFSGSSIQGYKHVWNAPELVGIGVTAGGGAYLIGSLASLPYALATAEEDFIAPEHVQALIWQAAGPSILVDAVEPRWWDVTPTELHAATLYQKSGEEMLRAAPGNAELRGQLTNILADLMSPRRLEMTERELENPADATAWLAEVTPAEKFDLAVEYRAQYPSQAASFGPASQELEALAQKSPADVSAARLSKDFGVPHPTLEQTNTCSILTIKPLPAYSGEAYGLMGESWESSNLYWGRLADEMGYAPESLNVLIPELSRRMIAKIFATDLEDWPAILRAMEQTGEEFRQGGIRIAGVSPTGTPAATSTTSSLHALP